MLGRMCSAELSIPTSALTLRTPDRLCETETGCGHHTAKGENSGKGWSEFAFVMKTKVVITGSFEVPRAPNVQGLTNPCPAL